MGIGKDIFELEAKLGYKFKDLSYLERALTHLSYAATGSSAAVIGLPTTI